MSLLLLLTGPSGNRPLAGQITGQSATSSALTVRADLTGTVQGQSSVSGTLTNTPSGTNPLTGTITAQSTVTGTITVLRPLSGTITAQSTVSLFLGTPGAAGKFVLKNARVKLNGQDLSSYCSQVELDLEREEIDITPLGSPYQDHMQGMETGTFTVSMFHDPTVHTPGFWTSGPNTIEIAPRNYPAAPDNPTWTATVTPTKRTMLKGQAGEAAGTELELQSTGPVLQLTS